MMTPFEASSVVAITIREPTTYMAYSMRYSNAIQPC